MLRTTLLSSLALSWLLALGVTPAALAVDDAAGCRGLPATIVGTDGADTITGTPGDDVIVALGGDDVVLADDGDDVVCGGPGRDEIDGGAGADSLFGGAGGDMLRGGSEEDRLGGGRGNDRLIGGSGDDVLRGSRGNDRLSGSFGFDIADGGRDADGCHRAEWVIACDRPVPADPGDTVNCTDFATWRDAQIWFDRYVVAYGDVAHLDNNGDGTACETLPGAPRSSGPQPLRSLRRPPTP